MPPSTTAPTRQKKTSGSPGKTRGRPRSGTGRASATRRPGRWRAWPIGAAVVVFLAAYILDTGAVIRLIGACLAGQFGPPVRIVAFAALGLLGCVLAWALFSPQPAPAAATGKPRRPRTPAKAKPASAGPEATVPADNALAPDQAGSPKAPGRRASSRRPPMRT
ncbi:hypothetical protein [Rhodopila globiformis]|uniref:Uncharacterized protein n=1 Tax=Rhodopila globiformis TaxID=1071 RepID=A0A2S6N4Y1_RHOGL|nr:hypothetical protein [Rhodopila globiformis]PPQ29659.1 hypothetical protein CCS01_20925 [Rhodopila globiformis]